jgi:site-specific recombinase XerD
MLALDECIKHFIDDYSFKLEKSTLKIYETSIRQLLGFCEKSYIEITTRDIRNWLMQLEENGYKKSTIKKNICGLRLFYQYCFEEEHMAHNPVAKISLPKDEDKLPKYLTHEQMTHLKVLCEGNLKHRAVIELLYTTGIRITELTNMKLDDINWNERMIHIPKGKGKKERIVLFTKECEELLKAYLQTRNDELPLVFLNHNGTKGIQRRSIQRWLESYRSILGITLSPHTLRHTFAAHLAMKGMPLVHLQRLLGHENSRHTHLYARLHGQAQKQMYDEWM